MHAYQNMVAMEATKLVHEHEALMSKYFQLNSGKGHQIWWLYKWFRNLTFGHSINGSFYGRDRSLDHRFFFLWLPHDNLRTLSCRS